MAGRGRGEHHVTFDEDVIREHDKLRGTRQKIDEPDTPFHRGSFDGSGDLSSVDGASVGSNASANAALDSHDKVEVVFSSEALLHEVPKHVPRNRMTSYEEVSSDKASKLDWDSLHSKLSSTVSGTDTEPGAAKASKRSDFEDKRKNHYNEFQMMKKWQEEHMNDEEEEEG